MNLFQPLTKYTILIFICLLSLNCPKRVSVKTSKIEVIYLSSLLEDIQRPEPYLCSIKDTKGIKVGYINFETPFMPQIFQRLGFYQFLSETPLDFLITNYPVYEQNFLSVPLDLGYGIKNYEGIRFAICSQYRDSLTISDQVKLATIKERSDVLWMLDKKLLSLPAMQIDFIIRNRILQDTMVKKIQLATDTTLQTKLNNFNQLLNKKLGAKINLNNLAIADYIFSRVKQRQNINIMLYPKDLIKDNAPKDSITIADFLKNTACDTKFKIQVLTKDEVNKMIKENGYSILGSITKKNMALGPDKDGEYLFDLIFY